jgi:hypothetical protein
MFFKAIGAILVAFSGLLVQIPKDQPPAPSPEVSKQTPKDHHYDPTPASLKPAKVVESEPENLKPLAKAVISTWNGGEVPKLWPCGVPLDLTSIGSVAGDHPQSLKWDIQPAWVDQYSHRTPGGRQVSIATGTKSKTIRVTLYVAKDDTFDMTSVTVAVRPDPSEPGDGDRPVPPGPKPPEPVPPEPVPPEPVPVPPQPILTEMGKQVHDLAIMHIPDIATRKDKVRALAASHEAIAADVSQAVAGVPAYAHLKEPAAIVDATVKSNRVAVGTDRPAFVPFFTALNGILKPLATTTLSTAGGHIAVWQDIAAGLRAAAP